MKIEPVFSSKELLRSKCITAFPQSRRPENAETSRCRTSEILKISRK